MKKRFKNRYTFEEVTGVVSLNHISHILAESRITLEKLAPNADDHYHSFFDRDKNGKRRLIDRPSGQLGKIQRKIYDRILKLYHLSDITFGAVHDRSPRDNATRHIRKPVVVRLDLSDCFHSTKAEWVYRCFRQRFHYSHQVAKLLTRLCTYKGSVPVGSPSSSMLINVVLDPLWREIEDYCRSNLHEVTIWVDDIVISGPDAHKLIEQVKRMINSHRLRIGWYKLKIQRANKAQEVTGCNVNTSLGVPRKKRREYAYTAKLAQADPKLLERAKGQLAFTQSVNPTQGKQLGKLLGNLLGSTSVDKVA